MIGFLVGLAAHVSGFLLKSWETTEPLSLLADLLYTLGWALWTGVVVVVFFQIVPEAKRRQLKQQPMPSRRRCAIRPGPGMARPRARRAPGKTARCHRNDSRIGEAVGASRRLPLADLGGQGHAGP